MALKSYKPTTPGQRGLVLIDRSELWKGRPVKSLTEGLTKSGGRNNTGRITSRRRGGGAKRLYRIVDFKRNKYDVGATVARIEYDPNRTAFIALDPAMTDGEQAYILGPAATRHRRPLWLRVAESRRKAGQRDAVLGHAHRDNRSQHRTESPARVARSHAPQAPTPSLWVVMAATLRSV